MSKATMDTLEPRVATVKDVYRCQSEKLNFNRKVASGKWQGAVSRMSQIAPEVPKTTWHMAKGVK